MLKKILSFSDNGPTGIYPGYIWKVFSRQIVPIYRSSGYCQTMAHLLKEYLTQLGFETVLQPVGTQFNVIALRNVNRERGNAIIFQAHMDMVSISEDPSPWADLKPVIPIFRDGNIYADHPRTLGADDGIGIAFALAAAADPEFQSLPMQLIFTVDEETSMAGAAKIASNELYGKYLINIDSEELNKITIGCASCCSFQHTIQVPAASLAVDSTWSKVSVAFSGATGGHSAKDIAAGRAHVLQELLKFLADFAHDLRLLSIDAGEKENSIPQQAKTVFFIPSHALPSIRERLEKLRLYLTERHQTTDSSLKIEITSQSVETESHTVLDLNFQIRMLQGLARLPIGVISQYDASDAQAVTIKTSQNLGVFKLKKLQESSYELTFKLLLRSSNIEEETAVAKKNADLFEDSFGVRLTFNPEDSSPAWPPNFESELLGIAKAAYEEAGIHPETDVSHGGLESAIFAKTRPDIQQISIGPDIDGAHTTTEHLRYASIKPLAAIFRNLLHKLRSRVSE